MLISDGSYVVPFSLGANERLLMQSAYDVEEISKQGKALNPINLFVLGSTFKVGRLFLTDQRLILLPFSKAEVKKGRMIEQWGHVILDHLPINAPKAKISFEDRILQVPLHLIVSLNPYRKQFHIHPTLYIFLADSSLRFKFVPRESPKQWAQKIADHTGCRVEDMV